MSQPHTHTHAQTVRTNPFNKKKNRKEKKNLLIYWTENRLNEKMLNIQLEIV